MTIRPTVARIMSLCVAAAIATTGFAQEAAITSATQTLPIGEWFCNGNETDTYRILEDKTAVHGNDHGTWLTSDNLLTISWKNGYRLTFDITQKGSSVIANSYAPGKNQPDKLKFTRPGTTFPVERAITDTQGRVLKITILAKDADSIKVRLANGKELEISLDKLSDADRVFVADCHVKVPIPVEFSRNLDPKIGVSKTKIIANFGYHVIVRIKENTFAVETHAKADKELDRPRDNCAYAISYTIRRMSKLGNFEKIKDGVAKHDIRPSNMLAFELCELRWGARGSSSGYLDHVSSPEGTEIYTEQLATLENFDTQIDPTKWIKLSK